MVEFLIVHAVPKKKIDHHTYNVEYIRERLTEYGTVNDYYPIFADYEKPFNIKDMSFETVADDIAQKYNGRTFIAICYSHASPYGLFFASKYPEMCKGVVAYPLRLYSQESLNRRIWKFKDRKGWEKYVSNQYDVNQYFINTTNDNFRKLIDDINEETEEILYLNFDINLQKQHAKIPRKFKTPTVLFSRLDMDMDSIIKLNFERKDIADMKHITNENEALLNSTMWNFHRVQYDKRLIENNKDNNNLKIYYIIGGIHDIRVVIDAVKMLI